MVRLTTMTLAVLVLAQLTELQCQPLTLPGSNAGAPTSPFVTPARPISTAAEASLAEAEIGDTVELFGTSDADSSGDVFYSWVQTRGPGVSILNANTANAGFVAPSLPEDTVFAFLVTTRNSAGERGRSSVEVTVRADPDFDFSSGNNNSNLPGNSNSSGGSGIPVANAGADQSVAGGSTVRLNGSNSRGRDIGYTWTQVGGTNVTLTNPMKPQPTFTAPAFAVGGVNRLEFELTVRDSSSRTSSDRVVITITDGSVQGNPRARIVTNFGSITVELFPDDAPVTVQNFLQYVDDNYYNGLIFHRVIPAFVVQGGGFQPGLTPRTTRDPIVLEAGLPNDRGTIAMARTSDPDSATSQFYINVVDNADLNASGANPGYAVFGEVIDGLNVVDLIAAAPTTSRNGFNDVPVQDIIIQRIERVSQ